MILRVFFVAEVQNKGIAKENLTDENSHHILSGTKYSEIVYLQKKKRTKTDESKK